MRGEFVYLRFGCLLRKLNNYVDDRGHLTPLFQDSDEELATIYTSTTWEGEERDKDQWHMHKIQTDRFVCVHGLVRFLISDGITAQRIVLEPSDNPVMLYIPPGVYHKFDSPMCNSVIVNFPTHEYNSDDEYRIPISESFSEDFIEEVTV